MEKKYKVLIVDDDTFLLDMYSIKFREQNFDIDIATSGEDTLNKLRDGFAPDIILLDLVMPGISGFEFLEVMDKEKLHGDSLIMVLSNQGEDQDIERANKLGVDGYIVKASAIPSEVLERVNKLLAEKSK